MVRVALFLVLAAAVAGYAFWVYRSVELSVPGGPRLAAVRALVLVTLLGLLFDPRLPSPVGADASARWVVLDASLSMGARAADGTAWERARARAAALEQQGWRVALLGGEGEPPGEPAGTSSRLAPLLARAAESGVREVTVLSDGRFEDPVGVRAALAELPVTVSFEGFGGAIVNAGVAAFEVEDAPRPDRAVTATVELFGEGVDTVSVTIVADGEPLTSETVVLPSAGLRRTVSLELRPPDVAGRVRYTARVEAPGDAFPTDDERVAFASVGHEEGALVLVSLAPGWEPRYLLPVLQEVTGLPGAGFLRVGPDRFAPLGSAVDRGGTVDSAAVSRTLGAAALVVIHGLSGEADAWARAQVARPRRVLLMPEDAEGAALAGLETARPRAGEWYASGDLPASPIAAELSGATLLGLPPLANLLVPSGAGRRVSPLDLQLRGTGAPEAALDLGAARDGRRATTLATGFWRWAMREGQGADAYRRLWSGVAGWLLADAEIGAPEPRPERWVFERGDPVRFEVPGDSASYRLELRPDATDGGDAEPVVLDTVAPPGALAVGAMPPGSYHYRFSEAGETVSEGRFDVADASLEMAHAPVELEPVTGGVAAALPRAAGRPLRTSPWPYLLVILLLCGEWIVRRRSGLR